MLDSDLEETFSFALAEMGMKDALMLQQFMPDLIRIRPDMKQQSFVVSKEQFLGEYDFMVKTSMNKNTVSESQRIQNAITQLINMANSGRPEFQNMKLVDAIKDWIKTLEIGDPDLMMPDVQEQLPQPLQIGAPQGAPQPQPQGGINAQIAEQVV